MNYKGITVLVFAFLILVGGIFGYVKAQSAASLMMGVLSSLFLCLGAFLMLWGKKSGYIFSLVLTILLGTFFSYRFILTQHFMPAGLMSIISLAVLAILCFDKLRDRIKIT